MVDRQESILKRVIWALVLLGGALLLFWGGRLAQTGLSLRRHLAQALALADAPEAVDSAEVCDLVRDLRHDVTTLERRGGFLVELAPSLGWLPKIGGDLRAAPYLLAVADGLTEAGAIGCDVVEAALPGSELGDGGGEEFSPESVTHLLADAQPDLERALAAVDGARRAWARADSENLSPWLEKRADLLDQGLPLLWAGLKVATVTPDLMGLDEPRTYLILAQNEDELRPTGGFISGAGLLIFDGGQIAGLSFGDAYEVDDYENKPYPEPPEPLFNYMGSEMWLFRDANWSPDFPTSARQAASLYEYGQGVSVDGVIALDQRVLELLLEGFGQVSLPGTSEPVTADNVRQFMRDVWNPGQAGVTAEWVFNRKEFMGQLATALLSRVEDAPDGVDWVQVAAAVYRALEGRHLLIFVEHEDAADALAQVGWDGAWRESEGDYLMVVDSNLGFNKANPLISEGIAYRVSLRADGTAAAELTLTYEHEGQKTGVRCQHQPMYTGDLAYKAIMHRCYYDYVRVYVPPGSVLRASTPHPTPGDYLVRSEPDDGKASVLHERADIGGFAQFFVVEYGQTLTTRFGYDLPRVARSSGERWRYTLLIQKQPGTDSRPVSLTLVLPPGARLLKAAPAACSVDGETLTCDLVLDTDIFVEFTYMIGE